MKHLQFTDTDGVTYERITKQKARKLYNNGKNVIFCPVNIRPSGFYNLEILMNIQYDSDIGILYEPENSFDKVLNRFEFYNCNCTETGYYTAFYFPIWGVNDEK